MSIKRLFLMTTLAAAMLPAGVAFCQPNDYRMDPPFTDFTPFNEYTPFVEPGYFDHDLQFFAPSEIDEFSGPPKPKTGFFGEYQRMYIGNPRGRGDIQNFAGGDMGWGNRFTVGYMLDTGSGWTAEYQHSTNSYSDFDTVTVVGINAVPALFVSFPNTNLTNVQNDFQSVELDKVFRMDQWDNGGYWEAFVGGKYAYNRDQFNFQFRTDNNAQPAPGQFVILDVDQERQNHIVLASLGARFSHRKGSWRLNGEFRMFGGVNYQSTFTRVDNSPIGLNTTQTTTVASQERFVVGGDVLMQAEYFVTRDISLTSGWVFEYYGRGVNTVRADGGDSLTRVGLIFGVVVNR